MKLYLFSFSPTGNTQKVLSYISESFKCDKEIVDLTDRKFKGENIHLEKGDVALVGAPVFSGRIPELASKRLSEINGNGAFAVAVAVYGNRATDYAVIEIPDILKNANFQVIAAAEAVAEHSISREIAKGRPDDEDKKELFAFGEKIIKKLSNGDYSFPSLPENRELIPLKKGMIPYGTEKCINCKICVDSCPVNAIPLNNPRLTDEEKCISCMRCISVCPVGARENTPEKVIAIENKLKSICPPRNSNNFYF